MPMSLVCFFATRRVIAMRSQADMAVGGESCFQSYIWADPSTVALKRRTAILWTTPECRRVW